MTSLLHLDASAGRFGDSVSRRLTALFADTWRRLHGAADYRYRDLAAEPVPPLTAAYCALGRRVGEYGAVPLAKVSGMTREAAERREWELTLPLVTELLAAGTVLLGVPMYNFSVPASLKAWIDRVTFPGVFTDPGTGESLLRGTEVVVVTARGGGYGPGTPRESFDFQAPYLRMYFGELGVAKEDLHLVHAELTRAGSTPETARFRELAERSLAEARAAVIALAARPVGDGGAASVA